MTATAFAVPSTTQEADPVAEFIASLILTGEYSPGRYGITEAAIRRHNKVHAFALEHQKVVGRAPEPDLIRRKFPSFRFVHDMPVEWAAVQLRNEHLETQLKLLVSQASRQLVEGDPHAAWSLLSNGMRTIQPSAARPVNIFDEAIMREVLPEPYPVGIRSLQELTGGIRPGELWYVGARPGRGKSWDLLRHAMAAAEAGRDVVLFSMEMSVRDLGDRLLALIYNWDTILSWSEDRKVRAAKAWMKDKGTIGIIDPSIQRCDVLAVEAAASPNTLLLIDHVGLMRSTSGNRAVEDYKFAASISNDLKEIAQRYKVPIIAASQTNRRSENHKMPSLTDLAQTDAAGQDADLIYVISSTVGSAIQQDVLVKNRRGQAGVNWYTHFRPHRPSFEEVSRQQARTLLENEAGAMNLLV